MVSLPPFFIINIENSLYANLLCFVALGLAIILCSRMKVNAMISTVIIAMVSIIMNLVFNFPIFYTFLLIVAGVVLSLIELKGGA